jgi:hypothetical protein
MPDAEDIAMEQYRLLGHTFLIYETASRYARAAAQQCARSDDGTIDKACLAGNQNTSKAAAWFKLGERLGDPVATMGFSKLDKRAKQHVQTAAGDAEMLLAKTEPLPDAVERYAYQCSDLQ